MYAQPPFRVRRTVSWLVILGAGLLLSACGSWRGMEELVTPYRPEVVQGNLVSREQVEVLKPGMGRQQVRDILGTPLVTSLFHADRWDYVFTLRRPGLPAQRYQFTVFFKDNLLERFEGDTLPGESEFVSRMDNTRPSGKVPVLEATPEALERFRAGAAARAPAEPAPAVPAVRRSYPPLEPPSR